MTNTIKASDLADKYFLTVWNGPEGKGIKNGPDNAKHIESIVEKTFHPDYTFTNKAGEVLSAGTEELKELLKNLQAGLIDVRRTSFEVLKETKDHVEFCTTSRATFKDTKEPYTQYVHIAYDIENDKVRKVTIHHHTQYLDKL